MPESGHERGTSHATRSSRRASVLVALVFAGLCVLALGVRVMATLSFGPIAIQPVPALFALGGLFAGPVAVAGAAIGYFAYQAVQGTLAIWDGVGYVVLGFLAYVLWGSLGSVSSEDLPLIRSMAQAREFVAVAVLAAFGASTVVAWGYDVAGTFTFFPMVLFLGLTLFLSVVTGGLVLAAVTWPIDGDRWQSILDGAERARRPLPKADRAWAAATAGILLAWVLLGSAISIWFQVVELVPPFHLRVRDLGFLLVFKETGPFDRGGIILHVLVGVAFLTLWGLSVRRWGILASAD